VLLEFFVNVSFDDISVLTVVFSDSAGWHNDVSVDY
jgi:hypothetical protein